MTGNRHSNQTSYSPLQASHWIDPRARGLHHGPAHQPPQPRPVGSNDLASRLAQVEIHIWYATQDRHRMEQEGLARGLDNATKIDGLEDRLQKLEAHHSLTMAVWVWAPKLLAYAGAVLLFALVISGKMTVDQAKTILPALGLSGG